MRSAREVAARLFPGTELEQSAKNSAPEDEPVRILGRGLRAKRGVHLTLRAVREAIGKTQAAVASESNIDQADISRLENRSSLDDTQVATLGRYVAALGGQLELVARFGDKRIVLVGVAQPGSDEER